MGGELGNETYILLVSSALSPPFLILIGNDDFVQNLNVKTLAFLSLGRYLVEIESNY